MKGSLTLW